MRAYLGAATTAGKGTPARGVTVLDIDGPAFSELASVAAPNPMYVALSGDGRVLYSVAELQDGKVRAWAIDGTRLTPLGDPQPVNGAGPCHLSVHPGGRHLLSACYLSGTLAVHPVHDDGSLGAATNTVQHAGSGPNQSRQQGPHAHMIVTDPATEVGRGHVLAVDLGTDTVYRYDFDQEAGALNLADELRVPAGAGPRHLVIRGAHAYVANELDSTVTVVDLDAGAVLSTVSTRPVGAVGPSYPSAIRMSTDGRFLYVANRVPDEIAVFSVAGPELTLRATVPCGGDHPRDMVLSPDGAFLYTANQFDDSIATFQVHQETGIPAAVGEPFGTPSPCCLVWA